MSHYYDSEGQPRHFVPKADGKGERPTDVRDARKLGLVPSFSTIANVLDKEGVHQWYVNQILEACLEMPPTLLLQKPFAADWKKAIRVLAARLGNAARERGSEIHAALEDAYSEKCWHESYSDVIVSVMDTLTKKFGKRHWIAEKSFNYQGYGGCCDLHCVDDVETYWSWAVDGTPFISKEAAEKGMCAQEDLEPLSIPYGAEIAEYPYGVVIDFKTKDISKDKKIEVYDVQAMQLAAYRKGLGIPHARCYNVFINIQDPTNPVIHEWKEEKIQQTYKMFECIRDFWYLANKMEWKA